MLTALWLVLLILRAGTGVPVTNSQTGPQTNVHEPVIIIVK
jgi:hypothetical protein